MEKFKAGDVYNHIGKKGNLIDKVVFIKNGDGTRAVVARIVTKKNEFKNTYVSGLLGDELVWVNCASYEAIYKDSLTRSESQFRNPREMVAIIKAKKDGPIHIPANKYVSFMGGGKCNPR